MVASRLEAANRLPDVDVGKLASIKKAGHIDKELGIGFATFDKAYVKPILSLDVKNLRKYLDDNAPRSVPDYLSLTLKIMTATPLSQIGGVLPDIKDLIMDVIDSGKSMYSEAAVRRFHDAISLELDNETFLMRNYPIMFAPEIQAALERQGLDPASQVETQVKMLLALAAYLDALLAGNKKATHMVDELARLCLEYAEDSDTFITTIDVLLNEKKSSTLLKAYSNFEKSVERTA